jgi:hypothetical protein
MNDMEEGLNEVAGWVNSIPGGSTSLQDVIIHNRKKPQPHVTFIVLVIGHEFFTVHNILFL